MGIGRYLGGREVEPPKHDHSILDHWSDSFEPLSEYSEFHLSLLVSSMRRAAYVYGKCKYLVDTYLEESAQ
jgi:hypothetical protein